MTEKNLETLRLQLDKIDNDYLSYRIRRTLSPEVKLRRVPME